MRDGNGTLPWYVGKTSASLKDEALSDSKLRKYNSLLHAGVPGEPCFYFLAQRERGKDVRTYLSKIEEFMIAAAYVRNPELANTNLAGYTWCLDGISRGNGPRKILTNKEIEFCEAMGIQPDYKEGINAS